MSKHSDFDIQTPWFRLELTICQFRESWWPSAYSGGHSVDLFVPLPGDRTVWVAASSWWLAKQFGFSPHSEALASVIPEPPHECKVKGCEFETDDYGTFLTHDAREHAPESNRSSEQEGR